MKNILKNRKALSTVVTTLIILVVSVLLAGVVTYFAINVTSTRVQEESLQLTKQHVWFDVGNSSAEAALVVVNTGGRDVVLDKIAIRGQTHAWDGNIFYTVGLTPVTTDLTYKDAGNLTAMPNTATTAITLKSGYTMTIYVARPDSISVNDVGLTVAISIFSSQATYYKETNVEAV